MWRSMLKTAGATVAYALVHSGLASDGVKERVRRAVGDRAYDGLYRASYNVVAVGTLVALGAYVKRLPDREFYRVRGAPALALRAAQAGGLAYAAWSALRVGPLRFSGLDGLGALAMGSDEVPRAAVGQGPSPASPEGGPMVADGPFRISRHPLNLATPVVLWLNPTMTANLATLGAVSTLYFLLGSIREEVRLRAAYGDSYADYQRSGVPFYLPRPAAR